MLDAILAPLTETYFQKALIGGSIVAVVAGVVGCLVVLRRMAFLGDALSHAMIAGVAGGYLVMKMLFGYEAHAPGMLLGSLIAAIATVALISFVSRVSRIKEDTTIGIMYTGIFALGVVAVSIFRHYIHIDLMHFIMGDILGVADTDLWVSAFTAVVVLSIIILFFRHFQLATFDPVMAASIGLPVLFLDYVLTTCVSLVVVSAVSMVGVILVVGLLITPAATAYLLSDRLDRMMILSGIFGVTSVVGGLFLCVWLDSAGGGAIMLFCTLQFLVVLALAPKYGLLARWLRLKRMVPQQVVEDVLTTILRNEGVTPLETIRTYVQEPAKSLNKALQRMVQDGLLAASEEGYALTADGQVEADKVLRAHRLWESYLAQIGTPKDQLHSTAHHLEHIREGETIEYLDEKLGHPRRDPHGRLIP
ncbi:metal ABC transporter permease [Desulfogranum mediterraneum]|uniref:metal ABC transporter permease n=1 Tax=Desulfogranum mediterraneum TaxID=160661 RepID=UPI000424CFC6|nr:iron chelate uptake ABC transporter family permease subunit [Desulfogranum mediterraneum]